MRTYRDGKLSLTTGSDIITGVGTMFLANVSIGDIVICENGHCFEVADVANDTSLRVDAPAKVTILVSYAAMRFVTSVNFRDLVVKIEQFLKDRELNLQEFMDWQSGAVNGGPNNDGLFPMTDRFGIIHMVPCPNLIATGYGGAIAHMEAAQAAAAAALASATASAGSASESAALVADAEAAAATATLKAAEAQQKASDATAQAVIATTKASEASTSAAQAADKLALATLKATEAGTKATESANSAALAAGSAVASNNAKVVSVDKAFESTTAATNASKSASTSASFAAAAASTLTVVVKESEDLHKYIVAQHRKLTLYPYEQVVAVGNKILRIAPQFNLSSQFSTVDWYGSCDSTGSCTLEFRIVNEGVLMSTPVTVVFTNKVAAFTITPHFIYNGDVLEIVCTAGSATNLALTARYDSGEA